MPELGAAGVQICALIGTFVRAAIDEVHVFRTFVRATIDERGARRQKMGRLARPVVCALWAHLLLFERLESLAARKEND